MPIFQKVQINFNRFIYRFKLKIRMTRLAISRRTLKKQEKIICFAHPRCATQSIGQIIEAVCDQKKLNHFWGYLPPTPQHLDQLLSHYHFIFFHRTQPNDFPNAFERISFKGFHMIRDPRNLLVSLYFSHRFSHKLDRYTKDIENDRKYLTAHLPEEGLLYLMNRSKQFLDTMSSLERWPFDDKRLRTIQFEDYVKNTCVFWSDFLKSVDLELEDDKLKKILAIYSFDNLKKISIKRSGISHYRSAQPDDYTKNFTPEVKKLFKNRYGQLLVKMGYEKDLDW